ncbi:MAG: hypothetical protein Kow0089_12810 [Desulfobulbaceae bacterium]
MRLDGVATPAPILLLGDCVYCHTGLNPVAPIPAAAQPKVDGGGSAPTYSGLAGSGAVNGTLAGGDFYWVGASGDAYGHNVKSFDNPDSTLGNTPPGGAALGAQLECAGVYGCHGNPSITAPLSSLQGAHHSAHGTPANSAANIDGTTVGRSFRYLLGVLGYEDSDWQHTESAADHNIYQGEARAAANAAHDSRTISGLCAKCHGAYHNTVDAAAVDTYGINTDNATLGGQWIRHPTDYSMPLAGEYAGYATYQPETPVGKGIGSLGNPATQVNTAADRIVLCISCHRAHGSPYQDMLRWSYGTMQVGTGVTTGCMNCHTAK